MDMRSLVIFAVFSCVIIATVCDAKSRITVNDNGGYQDLVLAISPGFQEPEKVDDFVQKIKDMFSSSSTILMDVFPDHPFFLDSVSILLPPSWNITKLTNVTSPTFENAAEADVILLGDIVAVPNTSPTTLQTDVCGEAGRVIQISSPDIAAKKFVAEFIKYRYGVFDEEGQRPDVYFNPIKNKFLPNGCTDHDIAGEIRFDNGTLCDKESELPWLPTTCEFHVNTTDNETVTSSLLYTSAQALSSMKTVCDNSTHDKMATTKQNRLCLERSIMEVVKTHEDFTRHGKTTPSKVNFRIVQKSSEVKRRVVFVLDKLDSENDVNQAQVLRTMIRHLKTSFSDDVLFGLVTTDPKNSVVSSLKEAEEFKNLIELTELFKSVNFENSRTAVGLESALQVLQNSTGSTDLSGVIIFIAGLSELGNQTVWDKTSDSIVKMGVKVHVVASNSSNDLDDLSDRSYGQIYLADDPTSSLDYSIALEDAIVDVCNLDGPKIVPIYRTVFNPSESVIFSSSFSLDDSVAKNVWLLTDCAECNIDAISFKRQFKTFKKLSEIDAVTAEQLADPSGQTFQGGLFEIYVIANTESEFLFSVHAHVNSSDVTLGNPVISMTSWLELPPKLQSYKEDITPSFPRVYTQLQSGHNAVINLNVTAHVQTTTGVEWTINMKPVPGDLAGLYQAYITSKPTLVGQIHTVDVTATDTETTGIVQRIEDVTGKEDTNCSLNYMNVCYNIITLNVSSLTRYQHAGSFDWGFEFLNATPSRITDLHVTTVTAGTLLYNHDVTVVNVTLEWTAPGDQFDDGTAKRYDLRYASDWDSISSSFENSRELLTTSEVVDGSVTPQMAGTRQIAVFQFNSSLHEAVYIALRAEGTSGTGLRSNIATVQLLRDISPTPTPSPSKGGMSAGAKAVVAIVVIAAVGIGGFFIFRYYRKRRDRTGFIGGSYDNM